MQTPSLTLEQMRELSQEALRSTDIVRMQEIEKQLKVAGRAKIDTPEALDAARLANQVDLEIYKRQILEKYPEANIPLAEMHELSKEGSSTQDLVRMHQIFKELGRAFVLKQDTPESETAGNLWRHVSERNEALFPEIIAP